MNDITVTCVGDTKYSYQSDEEEVEVVNNNTYQGIFKLKDLPGETAVIKIQINQIDIELVYNVNGVSVNRMIEFVDALKNNTNSCISKTPGSNSSACISTNNGFTHFSLYSAGGDNPTSFNIKVPNNVCYDAFEALL
jgi:hypothetical protein